MGLARERAWKSQEILRVALRYQNARRRAASDSLGHRSRRRRAEGIPQGEQAPKGDALITREPGVMLVVQTADCIPILLADTKHRAIAAIHSGWRGTAQRIAEKTLGRMQMEFGTRPQDVIAALGPGIRGCCYEVGHDVVKEFSAKFPNAREWFAGPFDALENGDNDPNWLPWLTHAATRPRAARAARTARFDRREPRHPRIRRRRSGKNPIQRSLHIVPHRSLLQLPP